MAPVNVRLNSLMLLTVADYQLDIIDAMASIHMPLQLGSELDNSSWRNRVIAYRYDDNVHIRLVLATYGSPADVTEHIQAMRGFGY